MPIKDIPPEAEPAPGTVHYRGPVGGWGSVEGIAARHPGQTVLVVSHGGVLDCLYRAASRQELQAPRTWVLGNASINRLLFTQAGLSLVGWNDDSHLSAEAVTD